MIPLPLRSWSQIHVLKCHHLTPGPQHIGCLQILQTTPGYFPNASNSFNVQFCTTKHPTNQKQQCGEKLLSHGDRFVQPCLRLELEPLCVLEEEDPATKHRGLIGLPASCLLSSTAQFGSTEWQSNKSWRDYT